MNGEIRRECDRCERKIRKDGEEFIIICKGEPDHWVCLRLLCKSCATIKFSKQVVRSYKLKERSAHLRKKARRQQAAASDVNLTSKAVRESTAKLGVEEEDDVEIPFF